MSYFQGFVIPVPHAKQQAYLELAVKTEPIFSDYGATRTVETWGDDVLRGKTTDFFRSVAAEDGENVVFSWIWWPDRATCDAAKDKMMADERMKMPADLPFDGKRMVFGGFTALHDTGPAGRFGYVDGIIASVPDAQREAYAEFARLTSGIFLAHGATRVVDGWGEDVPDGQVTDFRRAVQAKPGETIVLGWVEWPDKATHDKGMAAVMQDPAMAAASPPWNGPTAIFGGFAPILDTDA